MKTIITCLWLTCLYCPLSALAQTNVNQAMLIEDVVVGAQSSNPRSFVRFKDSVFFLLRRTPTSAFQLNRTKLTAVNPVTIRYIDLPAPDSIVSDVVRTDSSSFDNAQLWFFTKRSNSIFEIRNYNGSNSNDVRDVNYRNGLDNNATYTTTSVDKIKAIPPFSDVTPTVYAELKVRNGTTTIEAFTNTAVLSGNAWVDTLDRDYLGNAQAVPVRGGTFLIRNIKSRPDEDRIEYRRDNGQPSSYGCLDNQATCPKTVVGVAADSNRLLYYIKNGTTNQLWYYNHIFEDGTGSGNPTFSRQMLTNTSPEIAKAGIYYKGRMYFKTLYEGLWLFDTVRTIGLKAVKGFKYTAPADSVLYPVDSLTLAASRAFFWAKTSLVPSGGIYEIFNDSAKILRTLNTNERILRFIELDGKPYAITKEGTVFTLFRINTNSVTELGKVNGIDIFAGYASLNNTFVYSGNNNDGKGQEPYKLSLISPCDNDIIVPTFTSCPTDMTRTQTTACGVVVNWTEPTATDNCAPPSVKLTSTRSNGSCFPVGPSTVTYTATDTSGRIGNCSFRITVTANPCATDQMPPTFLTCPTNITVTQNSACGAIVTWQTPTASDNCTTNPSVTQTAGQPTSGSCFPVTTTTVTFTARDGSNLTATCTFNVVVTANPCAVDQTPPTFTRCPTNITLTQNSACGAIATWQTPTATDNCTTPSVTQTAGQPTSGACFPVTTTTVTFTARDGSNLTATCTFNVIVTANPCYNDFEKPKLTCPANIVVFATQVCGAVVFWNGPVVTDNCGTPSFTAPTPFRSGSCIPLGTNRITYVATDVAGNKDSCSFTVTVQTTKTIDIDPTVGKMTLSPNPTEGVVFLTFESQKAREMTFSIYNYLGITLINEKRQIVIGNNRIGLNLTHLPDGFYMISPSSEQLRYAPLSVMRFSK